LERSKCKRQSLYAKVYTRADTELAVLTGQRILKLRTEAGLYQSQLGSLIGVTNQAIGQFERGQFLPSATSLARLATHLGCSADYLLGLDEEPLK
jgi:transcriptional regulator with XRE-family HTH domain